MLGKERFYPMMISPFVTNHVFLFLIKYYFRIITFFIYLSISHLSVICLYIIYLSPLCIPVDLSKIGWSFWITFESRVQFSKYLNLFFVIVAVILLFAMPTFSLHSIKGFSKYREGKEASFERPLFNCFSDLIKHFVHILQVLVLSLF